MTLKKFWVPEAEGGAASHKRYRIRNLGMIEEGTWQKDAPIVRQHVTVHAYKRDGGYRAVSLGMLKFGLPELAIEDASHARNALARASQFHPELKAKIRAKVHKKFPGIAMKMDGGAVHHRMDRAPRKK